LKEFVPYGYESAVAGRRPGVRQPPFLARPAMIPALLVALFGVPAPESPVEARFLQVAPVVRETTAVLRSSSQDRAVVLIHGLYLNLFKKEGAAHAVMRDWQLPGGALVRRLGREADIFAFSYGQTATADEVAESPQLTAAVGRLRSLGYKEVVLVGYSAGGVIARNFVEDQPAAGVTKVIQVCTPNAGSGWATVRAVRASQLEFLESLTKGFRRRTLRDRGDRRIPSGVEFACIVGVGALKGDGLVANQSQWSEDLQRQGVPAYPIGTTHWHVMHSAKAVELIAELVRTPQRRWELSQVERARKVLWKGQRVAPPS
jgi:pimeloyl-ACP methyl ester carboxylesterase